jgi:hypothetical protein
MSLPPLQIGLSQSEQTLTSLLDLVGYPMQEIDHLE